MRPFESFWRSKIVATPLEITEIVSGLAAAYPNFELRTDTIRVYCATLADLTPEVLHAAAKDCISRCKFFPTVAELREAAAAIVTGSRHIRPAAEAWGEFLHLALHCGHNNKPHIADPIFRQAIDALGWAALCQSENQVADRARFIEVYNQYASRMVQDAITLPEVERETQQQIAAREMFTQVASRLSAPKRADPAMAAEDD